MLTFEEFNRKSSKLKMLIIAIAIGCGIVLCSTVVYGSFATDNSILSNIIKTAMICAIMVICSLITFDIVVGTIYEDNNKSNTRKLDDTEEDYIDLEEQNTSDVEDSNTSSLVGESNEVRQDIEDTLGSFNKKNSKVTFLTNDDSATIEKLANIVKHNTSEVEESNNSSLDEVSNEEDFEEDIIEEKIEDEELTTEDETEDESENVVVQEFETYDDAINFLRDNSEVTSEDTTEEELVEEVEEVEEDTYVEPTVENYVEETDDEIVRPTAVSKPNMIDEDVEEIL